MEHYDMEPDLCGSWEARALRAEAKLKDLRAAVGRFLAASGHDLCHENRSELAAAAGLPCPRPELVGELEFALGCVRYRQELFGPDGPGSETEVWGREVARLREALETVAGCETPGGARLIARAALSGGHK